MSVCNRRFPFTAGSGWHLGMTESGIELAKSAGSCESLTPVALGGGVWGQGGKRRRSAGPACRDDGKRL